MSSVVTFADLPLESRAAAAINAIDEYALTIAQRCELVALAVWPTDATLPGPVASAPLVPDVDLCAPRPQAGGITRRVAAMSTGDARASARERFRAGASIAELAEEAGVPWQTVRGWVNGSRSG